MTRKEKCGHESVLGFNLSSEAKTVTCVRPKGHQPVWEHSAYEWTHPQDAENE